MEKPKHRPSSDAKSDQGRPARKNSEIQPVKKEEDVVLETYEQSPERPGGDRNSAGCGSVNDPGCPQNRVESH